MNSRQLLWLVRKFLRDPCTETRHAYKATSPLSNPVNPPCSAAIYRGNIGSKDTKNYDSFSDKMEFTKEEMSYELLKILYNSAMMGNCWSTGSFCASSS